MIAQRVLRFNTFQKIVARYEKSKAVKKCNVHVICVYLEQPFPKQKQTFVQKYSKAEAARFVVSKIAHDYFFTHKTMPTTPSKTLVQKRNKPPQQCSVLLQEHHLQKFLLFKTHPKRTHCTEQADC